MKTTAAALGCLALGLMLGRQVFSVEGTAKAVPRVDGHGDVRRFPDAVDQPREGARIVVDFTAPGARDQVHPGMEKLARYVNIYAAAGKGPARVQISVVLHGEATEVALGDNAYAKAFNVQQNPNLPLLRELNKAGVQFEVCGQSLTSKGYQPEQVAAPVQLAVSALTALVNHQQDGYAYISLGK